MQILFSNPDTSANTRSVYTYIHIHGARMLIVPILSIDCRQHLSGSVLTDSKVYIIDVSIGQEA